MLMIFDLFIDLNLIHYFFADELNQTTTLVKPRNSKSIKVNVDVQEIGDMKLHISNLLRGRTVMGKHELNINYKNNVKLNR